MSLLHPGARISHGGCHLQLHPGQPPREGRGLPQRDRSEVMKPPNSMHLCFLGAISWAQQKLAPLKDSFVSENPPSHGVK